MQVPQARIEKKNHFTVSLSLKTDKKKKGSNPDPKQTIATILAEEFAEHPFLNGVNRKNAKKILQDYLAMSQAFPYLQAGSQRELILHCIEKNRDISRDMELTSVVGTFLCWDEMGGNWIIRSQGMEGLPRILNTDRHFHSNMLRNDLKLLLKRKKIAPNYSTETKEYLLALYRGLANLDPVIRCAAMVAFESHAAQMIESLWKSLGDVFPIPKEKLSYFRIHVGGADPAEPYHVAMTHDLIARLVKPAKRAAFIDAFRKFYALNFNWCGALTQRGN